MWCRRTTISPKSLPAPVSHRTVREPTDDGREREGRPPSVDEEAAEERRRVLAGPAPVQAVLTELRDGDALDEFVVCMTCAEGRGITEADLAPWATFGGAGDLARQAAAHDTTMTF